MKKIKKLVSEKLYFLKIKIMHSSLWFFMIFIYQLLTFYKKKHIEFIDKVIVRYYDKSVYLFNPTIINRDSKLGLFARLVDQKDQKRQFVYLDDIDFDNKELILYDYKKYLVPVKKLIGQQIQGRFFLTIIFLSVSMMDIQMIKIIFMFQSFIRIMMRYHQKNKVWF